MSILPEFVMADALPHSAKSLHISSSFGRSFDVIAEESLCAKHLLGQYELYRRLRVITFVVAGWSVTLVNV